jgi:hypothetical protein
VRFRGVGTVEMDGRHVTFGTDAETAAAISDLERRIAAAQDGGAGVETRYAVAR